MRQGQSPVEQDRCWDIIQVEMDANRWELSVVSQGLDLCESTLCFDVLEMRRWVEKELGANRRMVMKVRSQW